MSENQEIEIKSRHEMERENNASLHDVMEGNVDFFKLPLDKKQQLESQYYNEYATPVEKEQWDKGWKPNPMFRGVGRDGNPIEWVDAETFASRFNRSPKRENKPVIDSSVTKILEELNKKIDAINEYNKIREEKELNYLNRSIDSEIQKARDEMDVEKLEALYKQKYEDGNKKIKEEAPKPQKGPSENEIIIDTWGKNSEWFQKDENLTNWAVDYFQNNLINNGKSIFENLRHLDEMAAKKMSEENSNQQEFIPMAEKPTTYGFGGGYNPSKTGFKNYDDLPNEAKEWLQHISSSGKQLTEKERLDLYNKELIFQAELKKKREKSQW